jgi:hypothetical protein
MPVTKPTTKLSPDELLPHLHDGLAVLGLGELRRALDETLAEPTKDDCRLAWLWRLVEPQLRRRLESRAERRIREARLPVRKTFEAFHFGFQPKLDKDLVLELLLQHPPRLPLAESPQQRRLGPVRDVRDVAVAMLRVPPELDNQNDAIQYLIDDGFVTPRDLCRGIFGELGGWP